jgi:hypothetical protein
MNRPIGSGHGPAAGQRRPGRLASRAGSAHRYRWRAAGVAASPAYLRRHGRSGDLARNADHTRSQPAGAGSR